MEIIRKATPTAPKTMIYGLSGAGKTTLATKLKNPLIIDMEGGADYYDVARTPTITSISGFYDIIKELLSTEKNKEFDTLVIDSIDWLIRKVIEQAAGITSKSLDQTLNKSNGGYGNGKQVLENHVRTFLMPLLVKLNKKGYGICLIAHAEKKHLMDSEGYDMEQVAPDIDPTTMKAFVQWCDNVFYLKNVEGERKLVLESDRTALAKNRLGLSGEVSLKDIDIAKLLSMEK